MSGTRRAMRPLLTAGVVAVTVLAVGCSQTTDLEKAQKEVDAKTKAVAEAQAASDKARQAFCADAKVYVAALDRYGKIFTDTAATVGDVRTLGSDLMRPHDKVSQSAQAAVDAHADLASAQAALVTAAADLETLKAGGSTTEPAPTSSTTTTLLPAASVTRISTEQADLTAALGTVTDETPLVQAGQNVNATAFALEVAWLRVLGEAGCLTEEEEAQAQVAVTGYTAALQTALKVLGVYAGEVDGIYGPATVEAVMAFQTSKALTPTGYVDAATADALAAALTAKGGTAAVQAVATTAAVQSTLKLAGYWAGAVNGQWTAELTAALQAFQKALGVPSTGVVDNATLEALRQAIADAKEPPTTTSTAPATSAAPTSTTSAPSTSSGR